MRLLLLDGKRHENAESGYGQLAAGLRANLVARGVEIITDSRLDADVALYVCPPYSILDRDFDFPVAIFTMHELEHLPPGKEDWPERLNRTDLVLTPTSWNRSIWKRLGVTVPIEIVPLGIDTGEFYPRWGPTCRILTVHAGLGSDSSRENWRDTLRAYHQAFTAADDVELLIKTWTARVDAFAQALAELRESLGQTEASAPRVKVLEERLDGPGMRDLYLSACIFVKNANREGWSLPCTEAVACGLPVAATEIQPLLSHLPPGTRWFELGNVDELTFLLRQVKREHTARLAVCHRYSWENTGAWVHRHLAQLQRSRTTA